MKVTYLFVLSSLLLSLTMAFPVMADVIKLKIIDQQQQGVPDVVIEVLNSTEQYDKTGSVAIIDQINKAFVPEQILIQQGQAVEFPNSDNIRHHVYSFSAAKTFELKLYADKPEKPILFEKPGVVVVGCNIHDSMIGYIYVAQHEIVATSSEQGIALIDSTVTQPRISLWHPYTTAGAETRQYYEIAELDKNEMGEYIIQIEMMPPPPRDTFEDTFGAAGHH